ncbi:MAG: HEAT repeat domain-containing protein [Candidatus Riflebacteria bacterium]|nr:HEAT repeat domain-containing protein [Candidatus Riflebacteria bacterium]
MDPVKDLFDELKSPDPAIRFSVLSRIEDMTWSNDQRETFRKLFTLELDPGIRFHMQKVLARLDRLDSGEKNRGTLDSIKEQLNNPQRDEISLALMLESVKRNEAEAVAASLRQANWPGFSQQLLPSVLKFLKKYGSVNDTADIEKLCRHHDPRVLSSAIEALEKHNPDRLKDLIVPLLINSNFGIRSRAVRLLHRWDPSEALRHFESMLFSNQETEKQAALYQAFFFPFRQIETLMLRYISVESDPEMIKKAGLIFMTNPERHIPAHLLEVRQACVGVRQKLVDAILKGVLQSLYQAKIVNAAPEQMLQVLETHFKEKRIKLFIEHHGNALKSPTAETRLQSALKLSELARRGIDEARQTVEAYLAKERDLGNIKKIRYFLESGQFDQPLPIQPTQSAKPEPAPLPPQPVLVAGQTEEKKPALPRQLPEYSAKERQTLFSSISSENFEQCMAIIRPFFKELGISEQTAVIKKIERFGNPSDSELLTGCLQSDEPRLLEAAIEALSAINPEALHPYLPQLIKHRFDEVKLAAIKVFSLFDKKQAISLVENMLFSIKPAQRQTAIFCLSSFDFHSVSHILISAVKAETDPENLQQIFSILRSNADEDIFFKIYVDYKACKTTKREDYEQLCRELAAKVADDDPGKTVEALFKAGEDLVAEEERKKTERAAYKLEKIQKIRQNVDKSTVFDASLIRFTAGAYLIGAVLTAIIWFLFLSPSTALPPDKVTKTATARKVMETITIKGRVVVSDSSNRAISIETEPGKLYKMSLPDSFGNMPKPGSGFQAQVKAEKGASGEIAAEFLTAF